jgi:hypothetical protein
MNENEREYNNINENLQIYNSQQQKQLKIESFRYYLFMFKKKEYR